MDSLAARAASRNASRAWGGGYGSLRGRKEEKKKTPGRAKEMELGLDLELAVGGTRVRELKHCMWVEYKAVASMAYPYSGSSSEPARTTVVVTGNQQQRQREKKRNISTHKTTKLDGVGRASATRVAGSLTEQ